MKIALLGYGKMGKTIEALAIDRGYEVVKDFSESADVCVDFSVPDAALKHIETAISLGKPIVVGTTGWEKDLPVAKCLAEKSEAGVLVAPNFSIGMFLFRMIVKEAALLFRRFEHYEVGVLDIHHGQKKDCPSGTAKQLSKEFPELSVASLRSGSHPGTHQILFDSPEDTIELTHRTRSREGFARGALDSAEWIIGKRGFFTFEDVTCNYKALSQP